MLGFPHPGFGSVGFRLSTEHTEKLGRQLSTCGQDIRVAAM